MFKSELEADRERWLSASPLAAVHPDAPPFFVIHGRNDTMAPVGEARSFVDRLRTTSTSKVVYAELPGAQHAFDVFPSIRSAHVVWAVDVFLRWARSTHATRPHAAARSAAGPTTGPTAGSSTGSTSPEAAAAAG